MYNVQAYSQVHLTTAKVLKERRRVERVNSDRHVLPRSIQIFSGGARGLFGGGQKQIWHQLPQASRGYTCLKSVVVKPISRLTFY